MPLLCWVGAKVPCLAALATALQPATSSPLVRAYVVAWLCVCSWLLWRGGVIVQLLVSSCTDMFRNENTMRKN